MIFVQCPFSSNLKCLHIEENLVSSEFLRSKVHDKLGTDAFFLYHNGCKLDTNKHVPDGSIVYVVLGLPGGKGGFGSMLRAIGAQIEKTTNREACRDLSGRRLRDINEEQRLKRWISKEAEREAEKIKRRKERIERLKSQPKHNFVDFEYEKERSELPDRIDDALTQGLQKSKSSSTEKRKTLSTPGCSKKQRVWEDMDTSSESETSETETSKPTADHDRNESSDESLSAENEVHSTDTEISESCHNENSSTCEEAAGDVEKVEDSEGGSKQSTKIKDENVHELSIISDIAKKEDNSKGSEKEAPKISLLQLLCPEDDEPVDLMEFNSPSELETLGLQRLKFALMARGLKCGGTITDRAQRLWTVRSLKPDEFPVNLKVKGKKSS